MKKSQLDKRVLHSEIKEKFKNKKGSQEEDLFNKMSLYNSNHKIIIWLN